MLKSPNPNPLPPLKLGTTPVLTRLLRSFLCYNTQQSNDIQELKTMIKGLLEQMETLLNLTTVLAKPR
jgi:hypothetical protein